MARESNQITDIRVVASNQNFCKRSTTAFLFTETNAAHDPDAYMHSRTLWDTGTSPTVAPTGRQRLVIKGLPVNQAVGLRFRGLGEEDDAGHGSMWGILADVDDTDDPTAFEYWATHFLDLTSTFGGVELDGGGNYPTQPGTTEKYRGVKTIDVRSDGTLLPGLRILGPRSAAPEIIFDMAGHFALLLELTRTGGSPILDEIMVTHRIL